MTRGDGRPRHQQIAADLRSLIMTGDCRGRLPTTNELMETYRVGSPTVRRALQVLKDEGFIEGKRGSGVYALERRPIDAVAYVPAEGGYAYKLISVEETTPPVDVQQAFATDAAPTLILRHRLMTLDGTPVELSWSYYPLDLAGGTALVEPRRIKGGAGRVLAELGQVPTEYRETVAARLPTTYELEQLELPDDVPVIRQLRTLLTAGGRAVEVTAMVKGSHLYEVRYAARL
jgi:GntR family transcriptional regulator